MIPFVDEDAADLRREADVERYRVMLGVVLAGERLHALVAINGGLLHLGNEEAELLDKQRLQIGEKLGAGRCEAHSDRGRQTASPVDDW